ncbi:MAG: PKD domain-containing protein [Thermoleophilaceae bacterium]
MSTRTRILTAALGVAIVVTGLVIATSASGRKVANPGSIAVTSEAGTFRVNNEEFDFDGSTQITFNGSLTGAGVLTIPRANVVFPDQFTSVDSPIGTFNFRIRITANNNATGGLNPLSGLTTLNASLRIDIDPQGSSPPGFGGDCRITPINVGLSTAKSGGVGYNVSNGRVTVADHNFFVPGAQGCGSFLGTDYNGEINSAIGIPTSNTSAVIAARTNPIAQKGVRAGFTATPSQGLEPLDVDFNAAGSAATAGVANYRWDFDGNGTFDQTTTIPTTSFTYVTPGVYPAKLRVTDVEGDFDETTRTITVQAREPDLAVDKSHEGAFVASSPGSFAIDVTNVGTRATDGTATVTDLLPESLPFAAAAGDGWTCGENARLVTCTHPGPVAAGEALPTITVDVGVTGDAVPQVSNTAEVSTPNDATAANNSDTDTVQVLRPEPDLAIDKSHDGDFLRARRGTYSLAVSNVGSQPTSGQVTVTDQLPAGLTFVSAFGIDWSCGHSGGLVTCTHPGPVGAGDALPPIAVRVNVASNAPAQIVNTASVATTGDENPGNNSDSDPTTTRQLGVDLTVDKSHTGVFEVGEVESYRIVARNQGTTGSPGPITVTDQLPQGLSYVLATGSGWDCSETGGLVTCTRDGSLQAGVTAPAITLRVEVGDDVASEVVNAANVGGPEDLDLANNVDQDPTQTRVVRPDLALDKSHSGNFTAGRFGTYTLRVSNVSADRTVGPITVTDVLPDSLAFDSATGSGWTCAADGQEVTCTRAAQLNGNTAAPPIALRVTPRREAVPGVTNEASVSTPNDTNAANDSDSDPTTVNLPPRATSTVTRVIGGVTYEGTSGGEATFSINVTRSLLGFYSGSVRFEDPGANHRASGQVNLFTPVSRFGLNGARGEAILEDGRQRIQWQVDDLSVLNLGNDDIGIAAPSNYRFTGTATGGNITVTPR